MISRRDALELFLTRISSRSRLSDEEREAVLSLPGEFMMVDANQDLVRLGEVVAQTCLVVDGVMGRFGQTRQGDRQISAFYIPGDMPDLHSFVVPRASWALVGLTRSRVFRVPHAAIRTVTERYPAIAQAFWRDCTIDAAGTTEWMLNVGRRDARGRTAHLLCEMALRFQQIGQFEGLSFPFPVTQLHLADALALTPVHVNRTLGALKRANVVTLSKRVVTIHNWAALQAEADFDASYLHMDGVTGAQSAAPAP